MPWLLDTNHWIVLLKGRCLPLQERLRSINPEDVWVCSVVKEDLYHGAEGYEDKEARLARLAALFSGIPRCRSMMRRRRSRADFGRDWKTAARSSARMTSRSPQSPFLHGWTLVTNNRREFVRIPDLKLQDWTAP